MNTKKTKLAALLWLSVAVVTTGIGVYANQAESPSTGGKVRFQMMQPFWSGEMMRPFKNHGFGSGHQMEQGEKREKFWFLFLDESSLTESQKAEIQKLQEERDEAIKKINDEFFEKMKNFIPEDKQEEYENFVKNHEEMKTSRKWKHQMRWEKTEKLDQVNKIEN